MPDEPRQDRRLVGGILTALSAPLVLFMITLAGGAMSPREHQARGSVDVAATPAQVYRAITDVSSFVQWRGDLEGVELLSGEGNLRWRERVDGEQITYEVVEAEAPRRLVTRLADEDHTFGGTWTFTITGQGPSETDGARVEVVEDGWVDNLVFRFFARFVFGYESRIEDYLAHLSTYAPGVQVPVAEEGEAAGREPRAVDSQGHRGARGHAPENTLVGFARALAMGVTTLEMDLGITADDVVVVHHDETLNVDTTRDADGAYIDAEAAVALRSLSAEALAVYDVGRLRDGSTYARRFPDQVASDGAKIPTLAEVIALAEERSGGAIRYNLEIKRTADAPQLTADPETFARLVLAAVDAAGTRARTTFQSFDAACLDALRVLGTEGEPPRLSCLTEEGHTDLARVEESGCAVWSPHFADLSSSVMAEARARGISVVPWTVNDEEAIGRILDLGVDGIISDYPDRVRAAMEERAIPLPPTFP